MKAYFAVGAIPCLHVRISDLGLRAAVRVNAPSLIAILLHFDFSEAFSATAAQFAAYNRRFSIVGAQIPPEAGCGHDEAHVKKRFSRLIAVAGMLGSVFTVKFR